MNIPFSLIGAKGGCKSLGDREQFSLNLRRYMTNTLSATSSTPSQTDGGFRYQRLCVLNTSAVTLACPWTLTLGASRYHLTSETLLQFIFVKYLSSITRWGIKAGINCGKSSGNCVHLSAAEYDATQYRTCVQRLAQGDLELPHAVGFPPNSKEVTRQLITAAGSPFF